MFTLDIPSILQSMRPGEKWAVRGDQRSYSSLEWHDTTSIPLEADMLAAELVAAKAWRISKSKTEAQDRIYASYPIWKQSNAAMGLYDSTTNQSIKDGVQAIRTAQSAAETSINALSSVASVVAFTW